MSKNYIQQEVDKIVSDKSFDYPLNMAMASAWIIGNLKGVNLKILNVHGKNALSDYFVIASAQNPIQSQSMANEIAGQLKRNGLKIKSIEGGRESDWILIDCGDIIVHIFLESAREVYELDQLWKDASHIEIPQSYYYSSDREEHLEQSTKDYF